MVATTSINEVHPFAHLIVSITESVAIVDAILSPASVSAVASLARQVVSGAVDVLATLCPSSTAASDELSFPQPGKCDKFHCKTSFETADVVHRCC
jgi:hypothetical protein